jgi:hypothetical protein
MIYAIWVNKSAGVLVKIVMCGREPSQEEPIWLWVLLANVQKPKNGMIILKNQATEMREFITVSVGLGICRDKGDEGDGEEILLTPNV